MRATSPEVIAALVHLGILKCIQIDDNVVNHDIEVVRGSYASFGRSGL